MASTHSGCRSGNPPVPSPRWSVGGGDHTAGGDRMERGQEVVRGSFSTRSAECWAVLESLGLSGGHSECHCAGLEGQGGGLDSSPGPARA